jgi:protein-S-isoprenylcysteine O-methyltransferase Ste14
VASGSARPLAVSFMESTPDIPLLIVGATVTVYWVRVAAMAIRAARKAKRRVALATTYVVWIPLVTAWVALPWIALGRVGGWWGAPGASGAVWGVLRAVAALVGVGCFVLTLKCWSRMGRDWRMDVDPSAAGELITDGLFGRIRHPIYGLQILLMWCTVAVLPTLPMIVIAAVHFALLNVKARSEEDHLRATHGDAYTRYAARTGRFVPRRARRDA